MIYQTGQLRFGDDQILLPLFLLQAFLDGCFALQMKQQKYMNYALEIETQEDHSNAKTATGQLDCSWGQK
jgi:hypothetical protein